MGKAIPAQQYKLKRHYVALGNFLQKARLKADLSQRNVSIDLGYSSAQFISNFERGIAAPPVEKLVRILEMYGASVEQAVELQMYGEQTRLEAALREIKLRRSAKPAKKR